MSCRQEQKTHYRHAHGTCIHCRDRNIESFRSTWYRNRSNLILTPCQEHTRSFYEAAYERFHTYPHFQLVQINLQENSLKAYLISLFLSSLRSQVAPKLQSTYLLSQQSLDMVREPMGLHNKHVGYTYLVGPDGKIRWAGSAFAEPDEARTLVACTGVLLDRMPGGRKAASRDAS